MNKEPPYERVDPAAAVALRPYLPKVVDQVIEAVHDAVPVYRGALGPTVRTGVHQALSGFLELIEGGSPRLPARDVYVAFGRAERRNGRSLDALQTAYRAGAQRAWRALAEYGHEAGVDPKSLYAMGEAIFAFIDQISSASSEGHAFEESLAARELAERRRLLLEALMTDPQPPPEELDPLVAAASWTWPETLGALVWEGDEPDRVAARMPPDALVGRIEGVAWALVPDPYAPGRRPELERALRDVRGALGPGLPPARVAESARRARLALRMAVAAGDGAHPVPLAEATARGRRGPLVFADEHLLELLLLGDAALARDLERRALAPLDELPDNQRDRLLETLVAWLDAQGEARPAAERLHVHVQTVRYRVGQLQDILGDRLADPRGRLELQLALMMRFG